MPLSPRARLVSWILGSLAALVIATLIALPWLVSLERFRAPLIFAAESRLHRKVEVGKLRLQIWSGLGVSLEGVVVHNPPGWTSPALLKAGSVSVKVAFLPLLARRIDVKKLVLEDVEITVERNAKGILSIASLTPPPDGKSAPKKQAAAGALLVSRIEIARGRVVFLDHKAVPGGSYSVAVDDIRGEVREIALDSPARFDFEARVLSDGGTRNLRLSGTAGPAPKGGEAGDSPVDATFDGKEIRPGKLWPYFGLAREAELGRFAAKGTLKGALHGPHTLVGTVSLAAGDAKTDGTATLVADWLRPRFDLALDLPKFSVKDSISGSLSGRFTIDSSKATSGEGELQIANVELRSLDMMPGVARSLAAAGAVAGFKVPPGLESAKLDILKARLKVENERLLTPDLTLSGEDASVKAQGSIGFDKSLSYEGTVLLAPDVVRSLGDAGKYLVDGQGQLPVPFQVSGDISAPKISVSDAQLLDIGKRALGNAIRDFLTPAPTPAPTPKTR